MKSILKWRQDLAIATIEEMSNGTVLGRKVMDRLSRRYQFVEKGTVAVSSSLKRKIQSACAH